MTIKVYDQIGKLVAVLIDSDQDAGRHELTFDVSSLGNGICFYTLNVPGFVQTRKMIILK